MFIFSSKDLIQKTALALFSVNTSLFGTAFSIRKSKSDEKLLPYHCQVMTLFEETSCKKRQLAQRMIYRVALSSLLSLKK